MYYQSLLQGVLGMTLMLSPSLACVPDPALASLDFEQIVSENNMARSKRSPPNYRKIAIDNVRVFNGYSLSPPRTVVIDGATIGSDPRGSHHIDAKGATLLPGLFDAHCHPSNVTHLEQLTRYGVTTGMSMACYKPEMCASLQNHTGLVDILSSTAPAAAPGSIHGNLTARIDPSLLVNSSSQVHEWATREAASDPDYFKIVAEVPGLSQDVLTALTKAGHQHGKKVAIHAAYHEPYAQAVAARSDNIQHSPIDCSISREMARKIKHQGQTSTPTLTMMRATAKTHPDLYSYSFACETVSLLHEAGVTIMAGTDANTSPGVPAMVPFGTSIHDELENLVEAGLSNAEALKAATLIPAFEYGLHDRGHIQPGKRADLVLVDGNPLSDIKTTRNILKVWVGGIEFPVPSQA